MNDSDKWYYHLDGIALGPFSAQVMESHVHEGTFAPDTLVWNPTLSQWLPFSECQSSWSQSSVNTTLSPGPIHIPLALPPAPAPAPPSERLPGNRPNESRPALKPIARTETPVPAPPAKVSFFRRLFGRKA